MSEIKCNLKICSEALKDRFEDLKLYILYRCYIVRWHIDHFGPLYQGMCPVCFDEWFNVEYQADEE